MPDSTIVSLFCHGKRQNWREDLDAGHGKPTAAELRINLRSPRKIIYLPKPTASSRAVEKLARRALTFNERELLPQRRVAEYASHGG